MYILDKCNTCTAKIKASTKTLPNLCKPGRPLWAMLSKLIRAIFPFLRGYLILFVPLYGR